MQNGQPVAYASRALTDTETRYAQIEKELLAIVFACDRFYAYIYGRDMVTVESDHQPLETIVRKPLNDAPQTPAKNAPAAAKILAQCLLQKGQAYVHGRYPQPCIPSQVAEVEELEHVSHTESLALAPEDLQRLKLATSQDVAMQELRRTIHQGWPLHRVEVPDATRPFFDFRDQMTTQDQLVFKGPVIVIPAALRSVMMTRCHATHIGIEGCL